MPDFWPRRFRSEIPYDLKNWIIDQYLSQHRMSIYCDASIKHDYSIIGVAFSYVANSFIKVKQQYTQPMQLQEPVSTLYAELKSIIFALTHFEKYIGHCTEAIFYSDVNLIERILGDEPLFKKISLFKKLEMN